MEQDAEHWDARRELVDSLAERESWAEASTLLAPLLDRFPKNADHLVTAITVHEKAGRKDQALGAIASLLKEELPHEIRGALEEKAEKLRSGRD